MNCPKCHGTGWVLVYRRPGAEDGVLSSDWGMDGDGVLEKWGPCDHLGCHLGQVHNRKKNRGSKLHRRRQKEWEAVCNELS